LDTGSAQRRGEQVLPAMDATVSKAGGSRCRIPAGGVHDRMNSALQSNEVSAAAAREFARALCAQWQSALGDELLGIYCIGSLAHGGFARRYSDIDMAVIVQKPMTPAVIDALRTGAAEVSGDLTAKLSIFWTDRSFAVGRFPVLDRIDYLDHAV